ncbi:MAG: hypothetical protein ACLRX5_06635 [Slackia sp.]
MQQSQREKRSECAYAEHNNAEENGTFRAQRATVKKHAEIAITEKRPPASQPKRTDREKNGLLFDLEIHTSYTPRERLYPIEIDFFHEKLPFSGALPRIGVVLSTLSLEIREYKSGFNAQAFNSSHAI